MQTGYYMIGQTCFRSYPCFRLVDAAKSAGAPTNGLVVDTAGRQRMWLGGMELGREAPT